MTILAPTYFARADLERLKIGLHRGNRIVLANADDLEARSFVLVVKFLQKRSVVLPIMTPGGVINDDNELFPFRQVAQGDILVGPHVLVGPIFVAYFFLNNRRLLVLSKRRRKGK